MTVAVAWAILGGPACALMSWATRDSGQYAPWVGASKKVHVAEAEKNADGTDGTSSVDGRYLILVVHNETLNNAQVAWRHLFAQPVLDTPGAGSGSTGVLGDLDRAGAADDDAGAAPDTRQAKQTAWLVSLQMLVLGHVVGEELDAGLAAELEGTRPEIPTSNISGTSLGLVSALAYIDEGEPGDLSGGRVIAATGVIETDGRVGAIAGTRAKTEAAIQAGAKTLLVPEDNYAEALGTSAGRIDVHAVGDITQAVRVLCDTGGAGAVCDKTA